MKDKSAINLRKSRNRGSIEHQSKVSDKDGDIMNIASKDVISIPPTTSIKETTKIMREHEFRRLPITDPGSGKILGIVTVMDILDFLGGGKKYNIIEKKFNDNFLAAINGPIREIMTRGVITLSNKASIEEVMNTMLDNQIGAIPIVNAEEKLVGIVTERDIALSLAGVLTEELVRDYMSEKVITTTPGTPLEGASKIMVRNSVRRIPIEGENTEIPSTNEEKLLGILTTTDLIRFFNDKELFSKLASNNASDVLDIKVSEIMVTDLISVDPLFRLGDLCELFKEKNIGGVPVVKDDKILGIITERDILRAFRS